MIRMRGSITYISPPDVKAKELRHAVKAGLEFCVLFWHRRIMPGHFTKAGGKKYGYQKRRGEDEPAWVPGKKGIVLAGGKTKYGKQRMVQNRKYFHRKLREKGHSDPLIWSGNSETLAKRSVRLVSNSKRAAAVMNLPKYFYQYRKDLGTPNKAAELTTVTQDEVNKLSKLNDLFITRRLSGNRERSRVTIG